MVKNSICNECGRTIESEFVYCPWCGEEQFPTGSREYIQAAREEDNIRRSRMREEQIISVEKRLEKLEKELNVLVLCAELAK